MTEHANSEDKRKTKERLIHELQSLRQKIADSDRLLDEVTSIYKEAPIGLCVIDLNLRYMYINHRLAAINGVPVEEHLGRTVREVLPDVAEGIEPQLRRVIETGEPIFGGTVEAETAARPGIRRTFQHNYYPIKSGDATVVGVSCVVDDVTELKRAEAVLRESETRYRALVIVAPVGIFHTDAQGLVTYVNEKWCEIGGMAPEEAMGTGWLAAVHPDDRESIAAKWDAFARNQTTYRTEYRYQRPDGITAYCYVQALPVTDADGNLTGYVGCVTDITERKRAEEALKESERTLASAQRIAGLGHWLWDEVENRIITVSEQLAHIFGVEPEEFPRTSEGWFAFIHPDDRERAVAEIERCIANQSGYDLEYRIVRSDNQIRFVRDLSEPLFDDGGRFVRTLGTLLDITDLKQTEKALQERQALLIQAAKFGGLGQWVWDMSEGRISYITEQGASIYDTTPEMFSYERFLQNLHPDDRPRVERDWLAATEAGTAYASEFRFIGSDSETRFIREVGDFLPDEGGGAGRYVGTIQDITERKQVERTLRENEEQLTASLREKEVLLDEVHHRVKNNFQVIALLLSLPTSVPRHEGPLGVLEEIKRRVLVMARLYEYLLTSEHLDHIDTRDFLTELINDLATSLVSEDRRPRFRVDIEDVALTINHALVCGQIISELVANSLKHAFTGNSSGTVDICLRKSSDTELLLTVKDDGVGLAEDFDVEACEGFGLRIVTALVNQLGGAIETDGSQGASFQIKLSEKR